jgi:hypothetical protein
VADRLILLGFFDEIIERLPVPALRLRLRDQVGGRISRLDIAELAP